MKVPKRCSRCKAMNYCSDICQLEHYNKTHKKHCKYLAGIKVKEKSIHSNKNCPKCKIATKLAPKEFFDSSSEAYPCMFAEKALALVIPEKKNKETKQKQIVLQFADHPEVFLPVDLGEISGKFTCEFEQCLSILAHICLKLGYTSPRCMPFMKKVLGELVELRFGILDIALTVPNQKYYIKHLQHIPKSFERAEVAPWNKLTEIYVRFSGTNPDEGGDHPCQGVDWWQSLLIFAEIAGYLLHPKIDFRSTFQPILDLASVKMPSSEELIKAMLGNDTGQTSACAGCHTQVKVRLSGRCFQNKSKHAYVMFHAADGYIASCFDCHDKLLKSSTTHLEEVCAIKKTDLYEISCDNCAKKCNGRPRCPGCQSKQYCSHECMTEDWEGVHSMFCQKIQDAAAAGETGRRKSKLEADRVANEKAYLLNS